MRGRKTSTNCFIISDMRLGRRYRPMLKVGSPMGLKTGGMACIGGSRVSRCAEFDAGRSIAPPLQRPVKTTGKTGLDCGVWRDAVEGTLVYNGVVAGMVIAKRRGVAKDFHRFVSKVI
jgi:hypothetical protein